MRQTQSRRRFHEILAFVVAAIAAKIVGDAFGAASQWVATSILPVKWSDLVSFALVLVVIALIVHFVWQELRRGGPSVHRTGPGGTPGKVVVESIDGVDEEITRIRGSPRFEKIVRVVRGTRTKVTDVGILHENGGHGRRT